ncbi:MAG: DUF6660 family protein [Bacteroidota bacterium]
MKRWIVYILSFYILFSAVVPCSIFDKCEKDQYKEQSSNKQPKKDCDDCSPFSFCSQTHGFTVNTINTSIGLLEFNTSPIYSNYYFSFLPGYHSSFFQPPRIG